MRSHTLLQAAALLAAPGAQSLLFPRAYENQAPLKYISHQQPFPPIVESAPDHHAFTVREQSGSICNAGVKQWTGQVEVSDEKQLFFCMFILKAPSHLVPDT
jgi:hypothetical protein